jgi:hypothetical protein
VLVLNAAEFPPEGEECDARLLCAAYELGWKRFICYGYRGQRFLGCGFGLNTDQVRFDVYGSSGDYLASGIDGMQIYVHGNAQDQLGQIMKRGKLVVYGDVGQTFMYGAKGGEVYIMGNAAGRPLINAVGRPRVVINGTALDFLAESFMAGDALNGGGFVIVNGLEFDHRGRVRMQANPYPGSNLFSLASGGAIYIRDPYGQVVDEQLNGGELAPSPKPTGSSSSPIYRKMSASSASPSKTSPHRGRGTAGPRGGLPQGPVRQTGRPGPRGRIGPGGSGLGGKNRTLTIRFRLFKYGINRIKEEILIHPVPG